MVRVALAMNAVGIVSTFQPGDKESSDPETGTNSP